MALWAAVQPPLSTNGGPHIRKLWLHYVYRTVCWWCFDIINVEFGITASSTTHLCPVYALNVGQLWWEALTLWLIMKQRFWYLAVREENCSVWHYIITDESRICERCCCCWWCLSVAKTSSNLYYWLISSDSWRGGKQKHTVRTHSHCVSDHSDHSQRLCIRRSTSTFLFSVSVIK